MTTTASLATRWQSLAERERLLALLAAALVVGALLWALALGPALATLRQADTRHAALDAQARTVQRLQAEAQQLQRQPRSNRADALRVLQAASTERLGAGARVQVAGDRATVTLQDVAPEALAAWLAQVRGDARAAPAEAHLVRTAAGRWGGSVTVALPPA